MPRANRDTGLISGLEQILIILKTKGYQALQTRSCTGGALTEPVNVLLGACHLHQHTLIHQQLQAMELPPPVWANIACFMSVKDWGRACGTCRAAFAARRVIACAKPRICEGSREELEAQWALHKWATCHSLFINADEMEEDCVRTAFDGPLLSEHAAGAAHLQNLHIISMTQIDSSTVEGFLMAQLRNRVQLLSVHCLTVRTFPEMMNLRHLVLYIENDMPGPSEHIVYTDINELTFKAVASLQLLETLYVESYFCWADGANLRHCKNLRHVGINGPKLSWLPLPEGCSLHMEEKADLLYYIKESVAPHIDKFLMRSASSICPARADRILKFPMPLPQLRELRLELGPECFSERMPVDVLECKITADVTPSLVLGVVDVACGLSLRIEGLLRLESLVVVANGPLELIVAGHEQLGNTLKRVYVQGSAPASAAVMGTLEQIGLEGHFWQGEAGSWHAQLPRVFNHSELRGCRCGACLSCLSRAGVPVVCEEAWEPDGFNWLFGPLCL